MCGLIFSQNLTGINKKDIRGALASMQWRGPDFVATLQTQENQFIAHARLAIIDPSSAANQPMISQCGRYCIAFNGEIYNHLELRNRFSISCNTRSDTETVIEGFVRLGVEIFRHLHGMFALVLTDLATGVWWAARDRFGIKPLYRYSRGNQEILASETIAIRSLVDCTPSQQSLLEWQAIRRPVPGYTFFHQISEVLPGTVLCDGRMVYRIGLLDGDRPPETTQDIFERLLRSAVKSHELADTEVVSLLSGGLDSSVIAALSKAKNVYTVGLSDNNEFPAASTVARLLKKHLTIVECSETELRTAWQYLISIRGEPLSIPNEGLIYLACKAMKPGQKVVLTGEGADELLYGYDRIFRMAIARNFGATEFLENYCYSQMWRSCERLLEYTSECWSSSQSISSVEYFFYHVHLPGLLRRMDFASMAASKEARVPFVSERLFSAFAYRPPELKLSARDAKLPLRCLAQTIGLREVLSRPKVGFSASLRPEEGRHYEYEAFQKFNLEQLGWS